jgi:aldehyde dehydrogenase
MSYLKLGKEEGAELLTGGQNMLEGDLSGGYYIQPTIFKGHNKMRIFKRNFRTRFSRNYF